jgi:hypothetical protein
MYSTADLQLFVRAADTGSLSEAARDLDMLAATASAAIKRLERRLQCRLFERTTRALRLTQQGEVFLSHTKLGGRFTIRLSIGNLRTEERHVERAWELLRAAAEEVEPR